MLTMIYALYSLLGDNIRIIDEGALMAMSILGIVSILIAWCGLLLAKSTVEPVIDMAIETRVVMDNNFDKRLAPKADDEIGALANSINYLIKRISDSMTELKDYSDRTREVNSEIQRKMVTLNDLLSISDFVTAHYDLSSVAKMVLEKLSNLYEGSYTVLFLAREKPNEYVISGYHNIKNSPLLDIKIKYDEGFLGTLASRKKIHAIDNSTPHSSLDYEFKAKNKIVNVVIAPIFAGRDVRGLLLTGNGIKNFTYTNEDVDLIKIFARQLSLAIENQILTYEAQVLSVKDETTDLFNRSYIISRLNEEICRAVNYQRPCSLIFFRIGNFKEYADKKGLISSENTLKKIAEFLKVRFTEPADKVGRLSSDTFAVILPEKNKKRAIDIANRLKADIQAVDKAVFEQFNLNLTVGVSENPIDGMTAQELLDKAAAELDKK